MILFLIAQLLMEVKTTIDKPEITVGDPIKYEVEIKTKDEIEIQPPDTIGHFEIRDKKTEKRKGEIKLVYTLTSFTAGEDTIPSLSIKGIDKKGKEFEIATEAKVIKVKSVLPLDLTDIKDIKSPTSLPRSLLPFYIGIALLCAATATGIWLYKKRKKSTIEETAPLLPSHVIAYERLNKLNLEDGKIKEYYIELSDIIRRYIEGRYIITAPTCTTVELFRELTRNKIEYRTNVKDLLTDCDMVKFAKHIPLSQTIEKDKERAKEIIDKTKLEDATLS